MKQIVVRYKTKPERTEENERMIEAVFRDLRTKAPAGVRYAFLKLGDGSFVHFAAIETADGSNPLQEIEAFRAFQSGIKERCLELPQAGDVKIVGHFRMRAE